MGLPVNVWGSKISFYQKSSGQYTKSVLKIRDFLLTVDVEKREKFDLSLILVVEWTKMKGILSEPADFGQILILWDCPNVLLT